MRLTRRQFTIAMAGTLVARAAEQVTFGPEAWAVFERYAGAFGVMR